MVLETRWSINVSVPSTPMESIEERIKQPKYNIDAALVYSFFSFSCNYIYNIKPNATSGSQVWKQLWRTERKPSTMIPRGAFLPVVR